MGRRKDPDKRPDNLLLEFSILLVTFAFHTSRWMNKRYRKINRKQRRQSGDYSKKPKTVQSPDYALLQNMKELMRKEVINIILITMAIINVYFVISENWKLHVLKILLNASFDCLDNNISWIFCSFLTFIASTTFVKVLKTANIIEIHSSTLKYVKLATVCHLFFQNYGISIILLLLIVAVNKITVLYEGKHCFSILYTFETGASFQRLYNEVPYSIKKYFREKCNGSVHLKKEHGMNMALRFIDHPISSSKNDMNEPFDIFVKSEGGKVFIITVTERLTVDEMKQKIEEKEGIKLCNQRLYFGGKPLFNNKHISHYNIKQDSFIHLHVAVKGGSKQNQNDDNYCNKCHQRYNASNSSWPNTPSLDFQSQQYIDHTRKCQNCSRRNFEICYTAQNMVSKLSDDQISKIGIQGKVPLVATMGLINEKSRRERIKKHSTPSKTTVEGAAAKSDEPSTSNPSSTVPGNISAWEELEYHTSHCFNCEYFYNGGCCMADSIASKLTDTEIKEKRNAGPMRLKLQFILGRVSRQRRQYKSISATSNDNAQREKKDDILLSNDAKINKPVLLKSIGMSNKLPPEFTNSTRSVPLSNKLPPAFLKSSSGLPSSNKLPPAFTVSQPRHFQPSEPLNDTDAALSSSSEEESDTSESSNDSSETSENSETSEDTSSEETLSESESDTSEETTSEETSSESESSDIDDVEEDSSNSNKKAATKLQNSKDKISTMNKEAQRLNPAEPTDNSSQRDSDEKQISINIPPSSNKFTQTDAQICHNFTQTDPLNIESNSTKLNSEQEKKEDPVIIDLINRVELLNMKVNALSQTTQQQDSANDDKLCQDMSLLKMNDNGHKESYNSDSDSSIDIPFSICQINRGKKEPANKKAKNEPKAKNIPREAKEIQTKKAVYEKLNSRTVRGSCPMCGTAIQPGHDTENHLNICKPVTLSKLQNQYDKIMATENSSSDEAKSSNIRDDNSSDDFIPANINRERKQPKSKTKEKNSHQSKSKMTKKLEHVPLNKKSEEREKQHDPQPSNNGTILPQIQINNTQATAVNNSILINNLKPEINQSNSTQQENQHQPEENPQELTRLEKALEDHQISYASDYLDDKAYLSTDHLYFLMTLLWSLYPETDIAYYSPAMLGHRNVATLETIENLSNGSWRNDNTNMMLFPVNENLNHWTLYVYDRRNHRITYYNPLGGEAIADDYYWIVQNISNLFNDANPDFETVQLPPHLQQYDKRNCGIYVFDYIHTLLNGDNIHDIPTTYDIAARRIRLRNLLNSTYQNDIVSPDDITDFNSTPSNTDRQPGMMTHVENVMERAREKELLNPNTSNTSQIPAQLPNIKIEPKSDNSDDNDTDDSNDSDVEILNEVPYKFIQLPSQVTTSNTKSKPLTEAQFDEKLNECVTDGESHSFCYLLTFKNATNDADHMLDEAFYYGFSTRIVLADRLKEHITNATKNKKGPLANFTPEQIDNVIIIPINRGKETANRILEAVLIRLEAELPPILNNMANELISSDEIESLISINSTQRENVINILLHKLVRAIQNYVHRNPIQITSTQNANDQSQRLQHFLAILMDTKKSFRQRLLDALEYEHPYSENDAPHHCYGVFHTDEDINKMTKNLIYFGQTCRQLSIRMAAHSSRNDGALYKEFKTSQGGNLDIVQLIWEKTNVKKCKDLEAIQIWLGLKHMLPIKLKLKNRLPLMPIRSPIIKKILLNKNGQHRMQLEIIKNGILENINESVKRHITALKTKTNLEFVQFPCDQCNWIFRRKAALTVHKRTHTGERPYKCDYILDNGTTCTSAFTHKGALTVHKRSHTGERPYKCDYILDDGNKCPYAFSTSDGLTEHIHIHTGERPYKCDYTLDNGTKCPSAFSIKKSLRMHKRAHTGERPYKCDYILDNGTTCTSAFTQKGALTVHKRTHTGERPYQCDYILDNGTKCPSAFSQKKGLTEHKRTHTGERPYKCDYTLDNGTKCPSAFSTSHALTDHIRTHTGERPYKCDYILDDGTKCTFAYSRSSILTAHKRIHTGERPYKCDYISDDGTKCPSTFSNSNRLTEHIRVHTDERPYKCDCILDDGNECAAKYKYPSGLRKHRKKHHPQTLTQLQK